LASAEVEEKLKEVVTPACNRIRKNGKSYRGLNPWQEQDYQLLRFLAQGHQALNGFRNKDLRRWLYPKSDEADPKTRRREACRTPRWIKNKSLLRFLFAPSCLFPSVTPVVSLARNAILALEWTLVLSGGA
jgi:hypothetical protein